jgi:putative two-component system response regulator
MEDKETVLVVDDEDVIRRLLSHILKAEGYRCREAGGAEKALIEMEKEPAALVILDIKMPGKSGLELLPEIATRYPDTAVIMATALADATTAIHCMKQGAYDYITKPFNADAVVLSAKRALEKRRLAIENRSYQRYLEDKVAEQTNKIRAAFLNAITALVYALEAKDKYTSGHSQRVAAMASAIAGELGLSQDRMEKVRLAALIHDIGKIGVKEAVLNKVGQLTPEEYQHVMAHSEIGEHILEPIVEDKEILAMVRHHHERYDGNGYPDHLSGEGIPEGARIVAVADAYSHATREDRQNDTTLSINEGILALADTYDALTSDRPYRTALGHKEAIEEIKRGISTQFDPTVASAFLRLPQIAGGKRASA